MKKMGRGAILLLLLFLSVASLAQGEPSLKLVSKLHLTQVQKKKLRALRRKNAKEVIPLRAREKILQLELEGLLEDPSAPKEKIVKKVKELGALQTQVMLKRVELTLALRKLLTPTQLEKLRMLHKKRFLRHKRKRR